MAEDDEEGVVIPKLEKIKLAKLIVDTHLLASGVWTRERYLNISFPEVAFKKISHDLDRSRNIECRANLAKDQHAS